ncbi:MAG: U32 family peptidase [Eggerthellaceae bacterium]|nr:U32 family peptidase [Eggerthellaceae bacterium]
MGFSALHKARTQALSLLRSELLKAWQLREPARDDERTSLQSCIPQWLEDYRHGVRDEFEKALLQKKKQRNATHKGKKHKGAERHDKKSQGHMQPRPVALNRYHAQEKDIVVCAFASNPACARAAKRAGAEQIYVSALNYKRGTATLAGNLQTQPDQAGYPSSKITALPVVDKTPLNRDEPVDVWKYTAPEKPVLVETFGQLVRAHEEGMKPEVGPHIPINNIWALDVVCALGAQRVWLSPELSLHQIREIAKKSPVPLGITISGYQELMTTEHCLLMSEGPCDQRCSVCDRRLTRHALKDRMGYSFQIVTDQTGRSHLYNSVMLDTNLVMAELVAAGVTAFMIDATLMSVEETTEAVAHTVRTRNMLFHNGIMPEKKKGATTGHLFRPIE